MKQFSTWLVFLIIFSFSATSWSEEKSSNGVSSEPSAEQKDKDKSKDKGKKSAEEEDEEPDCD